MHLKLYLDELSRVFFLKENMRNKKRWWLSMFYSLCIQSIVRLVLKHLMQFIHPDDWRRMESCEKYLFLPLRFFIARSGTYDPLREDQVTREPSQQGDGELPTFEHHLAAQRSINQEKWESKEILDSAHFLKLLFEDDGRPLDGHGLQGGIEDENEPSGEIVMLGGREIDFTCMQSNDLAFLPGIIDYSASLDTFNWICGESGPNSIDINMDTDIFFGSS